MEECSRPRIRWLRVPVVLLFALVMLVALNRTIAVLFGPITWDDWYVAVLDGVLAALITQAFRNWWYA
jgi:hypothetical protein